MKTSDKYRFKKKLKNLKILAWDGITIYSKISLFLFALLTCITFWSNIGAEFPEFIPRIKTMLGIVLINTIIVSINFIKEIREKR